MKKQYVFLFLIIVILYLLYLIINYKYTEFIVNTHIENIKNENIVTKTQIENSQRLLEHINTRAYKNKVLKREQGYKNKWEYVITLTTQQNTRIVNENTRNISIQNVNYDPYIGKNNIEKWIYFLFKNKRAN